MIAHGPAPVAQREGISDVERKNEACTSRPAINLGRGTNPHLAPGVIDSLAKSLNLFQLGHIGGDDQDVPLANECGKFLCNFGQLGFIHICNCDFQSKPKLS